MSKSDVIENEVSKHSFAFVRCEKFMYKKMNFLKIVFPIIMLGFALFVKFTLLKRKLQNTMF